MEEYPQSGSIRVGVVRLVVVRVVVVRLATGATLMALVVVAMAAGRHRVEVDPRLLDRCERL